MPEDTHLELQIAGQQQYLAQQSRQCRSLGDDSMKLSMVKQQ